MPGLHEPLTDALLDPATYTGDLHRTLRELRSTAPLAWNATNTAILGAFVITAAREQRRVRAAAKAERPTGRRRRNPDTVNDPAPTAAHAAPVLTGGAR